MPATSPAVCSSTSALKPLRSQYLRYMRSSIEAQSCASVPPEPAWMSTKQLLRSSGLENMRRNSSAATSASKRWLSLEISCSVVSSLSARASSKSSVESDSMVAMVARDLTVPSKDFFSRPSSWARLESLHTLGSARSPSSSARRFFFPSKSKIPPQLRRPRLQVGEARGDLVDAFGFHQWVAALSSQYSSSERKF